jgi:hypothetical protein
MPKKNAITDYKAPSSEPFWLHLNVGKLPPDYTELQPRRQSSSYLPPSEPQILEMLKMEIFIIRVWFPNGQMTANNSTPSSYGAR